MRAMRGADGEELPEPLGCPGDAMHADHGAVACPDEGQGRRDVELVHHAQNAGRLIGRVQGLVQRAIGPEPVDREQSEVPEQPGLSVPPPVGGVEPVRENVAPGGDAAGNDQEG